MCLNMDRFATASTSLTKLTLVLLLCKLVMAENIRVVSLNMNGRLSEVENFKKMLGGENVVVLQEVNDLQATRAKYRDYPYMHYVTNKAKRNQKNSVMILSKVPFHSYGQQLIQKDPAVDQWERHAHWVLLKTDTNKFVHVFHYHNTYNFHDDNSKSEREGLTKFATWVKNTLGVSRFQDARNMILTGDFNLRETSGASALLSGLNCQTDNVDYVCSSMSMVRSGTYATSGGISDVHNAPWSELSSTINPSAVVGRRVKLFNTYQNEYMYAASFAPFDNDRRRVFTWRPGTLVQQAYWRLEPVGSNVYRIFNTFHQEYLYAADYEPYDNDRRRIFTWRPGRHVAQGTWTFSGSGDKVSIYNTKQKEYLYAGDYAPYDGDRRRVFSWRPGNRVTQGYWRIENA